ncbi:hypothetical protein AgCh_027958 [Apium graveolens]
MCNFGAEDLLHAFFNCQFALACWQYTDMIFDMSLVDFAPSWLLAKLELGFADEALNLARVVWGIWFFQNKNVWENKVVTTGIAIDWIAKIISDWKEARAKRIQRVVTRSCSSSTTIVKWKNRKVELSSAGAFVMGKSICKAMVATVIEAEVIAILECLRWVSTLNHPMRW